MSNKPKFEAFYVQCIAAEYDSGEIFIPEHQYVDPIILNEILKTYNCFPCNIAGDMEVFTTNPNLQPKSESESINYVSEEGLKELGFESLFDSLIADDYAGIGDSWNPHCLSVSWSHGNEEDVEKAIANFLDAANSQADIQEYKLLKAKLGL